MICVTTAEWGKMRRLPFYLAMEEWVAHNMPEAEYMFTWVVNPTVIFGRNQCAQLEVDLEYCRDHSIEVYRRKSGGGCVYADTNNMMLSYVAPGGDVDSIFSAYSRRIASALTALGVPAEATGRNDIEVEGQKVSGGAFYRLSVDSPQPSGATSRMRSIAHSTLLWQPDFMTMSHAITPSRAKLESKKVKSVESRVGGLSRYLPQMSLAQVGEYLISSLCHGTYTLTPEQVAEVEVYERRYYDLAWKFGRKGLLANPSAQVRRHKRLPGVGEIDLVVTMKDGGVDSVDITGDFFLTGDFDTMVVDKIRRCPLERQALTDALASTDMSRAITGLNNDDFVEMLIYNQLKINK